jgi:hypothetical protein
VITAKTHAHPFICFPESWTPSQAAENFRRFAAVAEQVARDIRAAGGKVVAAEEAFLAIRETEDDGRECPPSDGYDASECDDETCDPVTLVDLCALAERAQHAGQRGMARDLYWVLRRALDCLDRKIGDGQPKAA